MKRSYLFVVIVALAFMVGGCSAPPAESPSPSTENWLARKSSSPSIAPSPAGSVSPPTGTLGTSRTNPVSMGTPLTTPNGVETTVIRLIKGAEAWNILLNANEFNDPPAAGMQYVIVTVRVKNISAEDDPVLVSDVDFSLTGSSNKVFGTYDRSAVLPSEGDLAVLERKLFRGGEQVGSMHFYTPENESNLVLIWKKVFPESESRYFEVH